MKVKICGMKFPKNILEIGALQPDYIGFIFYPKSKRFVGENFSQKSIEKLPKTIKKVGVFVNESIENILKIQKQFSFDTIQLHGDESVEICSILQQNGIEVIKVFSVDNYFDFEITKPFESVCELFLFDTKTEKYGGSGKAFDWKILEKYNLEKPFFLSGGLGLNNLKKIKQINHPQLIGLDFNSQLEDENYKKITEEVNELIQKIRTK
ncbi:MAG: phosphoribosylanthranilate isomerase [Flavobacterium sp.]|nr:phosphoribosylanthranilate isomerase [Flavobacterium sp.]